MVNNYLMLSKEFEVKRIYLQLIDMKIIFFNYNNI